MSTYIDKLARAAFEERGGNWDGGDDRQKAAGRAEVRAILTVMREPTTKMVADGAYGSNSYITDDDALTCWQAMLQVALDEK